MKNILIAGYPRSGNTYLGCLLSCHFNAPHHDLYKLQAILAGTVEESRMALHRVGAFERPDQRR